MKINELVIVNFKNYCGENRFDFTLRDGKNIILIGGFNGAGKTSLTEAIRLCLYGSMMNGAPMSEAAYQAYLNSVHCNSDPGNSFSIEMTVEISNNGLVKHFTINRSFVRSRKNFVETLSLKNDGAPAELIQEKYWSYYVEKIIPSAASRYFFFDGENIRNVISSNNASEYLNTALNNLCGIADLLTLDYDLQQLEKRIRLKNTAQTSKSIINRLSYQIEELEKDIEKSETFISSQRTVISEKQLHLENLESNLKRLIGLDQKKYNQRKNLINRLNKDLLARNNEIAEYSHNILPYIISKPLLEKTIEHALFENKSRFESYLKHYICEKFGPDSDLKDIISESKINAILNRLLKEFKSNDTNTNPILNLSMIQISQLKSTLDKISVDEVNISKLTDSRESCVHKIKSLESKLSQKENESISSVDREIQILRSEISEVEGSIKVTESRIQTNLEIIRLKRQEINREEKKTLLSALDQEMIVNIYKARSALDRRVSEYRKSSIESLNKDVNEIYVKLRNKESMVREITIDHNLNITLVGFDGTAINVSMISEGEKGILMYSVIHGLHKLSNAELPMIIDSPLGKMDSIHTHNLIMNYYPDASEQVILLSHDREITTEALNQLNDSISRKYLVRSEEKPKIIEGYFE